MITAIGREAKLEQRLGYVIEAQNEIDAGLRSVYPLVAPDVMRAAVAYLEQRSQYKDTFWANPYQASVIIAGDDRSLIVKIEDGRLITCGYCGCVEHAQFCDLAHVYMLLNAQMKVTRWDVCFENDGFNHAASIRADISPQDLQSFLDAVITDLRMLRELGGDLYEVLGNRYFQETVFPVDNEMGRSR